MASDETAQRLRALEDHVSMLDKQLEALAHEVEGRRDHVDGSMRSLLRCPACRCRKILYAKEILDRTDSEKRKLSVTVEGFWSPKARGRFECHICTACGLVEWHVADPSEIKIDDEKFEILEVDDRGPGPYR
ncbi:MAG: hypothetical protein JRI68_26960 [Deltaproteobacteria bacterium]|nr:hypothetical protein [Deltaproteobacteria bacterium]